MSIHVRSEVATGRVPPARWRAAQRAKATLHSYPEWPLTVAGQTKRKGLAWPVLLFLLSLMVPWTFDVGLVNLTAPRTVLLAMVLPCLGQWITGRAGRIRVADIAILLFCFWCALSLVVIHGADFAVRPAGMLFVETIGAYFLSRCYIRSVDDFFNMGRVLFGIVAFLFPFGLFEAVTGRNVLLQLFAAILPSYPPGSEDSLRGGLYRVQVVFEHPILFGICASSVLPLAHLVLGHRRPFFQRWWRSGLVGAAAILSMSSAPLAALALQALLMMWDWLLRSVVYRWKIIWGLILASFLIIEFGSNQSAIAFYISHLTLNPDTGWYRLLIWEYGSTSVLNNPLFGIGFGEWARASWMTSSVDMFWLLTTMRHGLPAGILISSAFLLLVLAVSFRKGLDERLNACRMAYVLIMVGFFIVGWTVHFWGMAYIWFLFLLGSGVWLLDVPVEKGAARRAPLDPTSEGQRALIRSRTRAASRP